MSATGIGAAVRRKEDQRFITGKGHYTDDINRPGQGHAYFLRSPHAHAKIKSVDSKSAAAMPGVLAVLTGAELAADKIGGLICGWMIKSKDGSPMKAAPHPAIAHGKANHVGDAVAVVIAETLAQAKDAAEKVKVDYEVLPAAVDPAKAQGQGAPQIHEVAAHNTIYQWHLGDASAAEAAIRAAKHVTKLDLVNNRLVPNAIEPRAAIGEYDAGTDALTLWNTTQNPHVSRLVISAFVGVAPEHKLRVIAPDVGGGFGSKIFIYPEEVVCLWASRRIGRPVKWVSDRSEAFLTDCHGRDHVTHAEMAFDADGKVTALKVKTIANLGAYMSTFSSSVPTYLYGTLLSGQYEIPAIYCEVDAVYTNTVPVDAYRGAGRPEATFVVERLIEVAAREMGVDPADLRKKNFIKKFPHQTPVIMNYDAGDYHASLKKAMEIADYAGFGKRKRKSARHGKLRGVGFSTYIEACGIAPSQAVGSLGCGVGLWESAEVRVNPTGSVELLTGCHQHGQGHETTFAQVICDRLGIPIDNISVVHGDTDKVQFGMGTYGSRSGAVGISAIVKALDKIETKAKKVAAHMLEAAEGDIVFQDGKFTVAGTDKSAAWGEVAAQCLYRAQVRGRRARAGIEGRGVLRSHQLHVPGRLPHLRGRGRSADRRKRDRRLDRGRRFRHRRQSDDRRGSGPWRHCAGVGQALLEGAVYDKDGQLVTGSLMDYCMPRAHDFPSLKVDMTMTKAPSKSARHQGLRRGGRDRGAGGGHQRPHRRDRHRGFGDAGDRADGVAGIAEDQQQAKGGIGAITMYAFTQHRPATVRQAASLLAKEEEAKLLAGGHTLIPTMKLRLAGPKHLVDLSKVEGLTGIEMTGRSLIIGAMTPHVEVATSPVVKENIPALAHLAGLIGDPAVRHCGTIGGSIANNDPNADYRGRPRARRHDHHQQARIAANDFFKGLFETALEPDDHHESAVSEGQQGGLPEIANPASRFALVGVFVSKHSSENPRQRL